MSKRFTFESSVNAIPGVLLAVLAWCVVVAASRDARCANRLVSAEQARHLGLERAWYAQIRLDRARNRVERAVLTNDRLDVLTTAGILQELNALTGETLWVAPVGNPNYPSLGPGGNEQLVAVLNGMTLHVLDRADGRPVKIRRVGGVPGAAPAVATQYVFVPLLNGRIEGHPLGEEIYTPWNFQSVGRVMVPPLVTAASVVWATDSGHVYIGGANEPGVNSRLETGSDILAPPAYRKPNIFIAAMSGELFAIDEASGAKRWKYATGYPITRAPAAVGDKVFVTSDEPALHCVDVASGSAVWDVPNITQFAAASRNRVYGVDELRALVVLDAATGRVLLRSKPSDGTIDALVNDQTDRLYLVSDDGLVQCFHEFGAKEPLRHNPPEPKPADAEPPAEDATAAPAEAATDDSPQPAVTPPTADEGNPFGDTPAEDRTPFGDAPAGEAEAPADTPEAEEPPTSETPFGVEENPFGT